MQLTRLPRDLVRFLQPVADDGVEEHLGFVQSRNAAVLINFNVDLGQPVTESLLPSHVHVVRRFFYTPMRGKLDSENEPLQ